MSDAKNKNIISTILSSLDTKFLKKDLSAKDKINCFSHKMEYTNYGTFNAKNKVEIFKIKNKYIDDLRNSENNKLQHYFVSEIIKKDNLKSKSFDLYNIDKMSFIETERKNIFNKLKGRLNLFAYIKFFAISSKLFFLLTAIIFMIFNISLLISSIILAGLTRSVLEVSLHGINMFLSTSSIFFIIFIIMEVLGYNFRKEIISKLATYILTCDTYEYFIKKLNKEGMFSYNSNINSIIKNSIKSLSNKGNNEVENKNSVKVIYQSKHRGDKLC